MLRWRLVAAFLLIGLTAGCCLLDYHFPLAGRTGLWLLPLALAAAALACLEASSLLSVAGYRPSAAPLLAGGLLIVIAAAAPLAWREYPADCPLGRSGWVLLGSAAAVMLAFADALRRYRAGDRDLLELALTVTGQVYVGWLFSFLILLRQIGDHQRGMLALLSVVVVVKMTDTGAYFTGRLLGGRLFGAARMAPILSPNKTWEGLVGGLVAACAGSWLVFHWLGPAVVADADSPIAGWRWLSFALAVAVAGVLGDLVESLMKRAAGVKDSSDWLPGLGGVLDVLDSILTAAPIAYAFWAAGVVAA